MNRIAAAPPAEVRVHIRWLMRRDMPEVLAIERQSFEYPWCEEEFLRVLRQRDCIGMVAECGERVVGFMVYRLHKARIEVLNFAVRPDFRRRDVGSRMVAKLVGKLSNYRRTRVVLACRETNTAVHLFFRSQGFLATDVLRGHYADTGEDAYVMEYAIRDEETPR